MVFSYLYTLITQVNKLIVLFLLVFTVTASEEVVELYELIHHRISLIDSNSDGIPDSDTSENSEDDTELNLNFIAITSLGKKQKFKLDNFKNSYFELFMEIPQLPPE